MHYYPRGSVKGWQAGGADTAFMLPTAEYFDVDELVEVEAQPFECGECGSRCTEWNPMVGGEGEVRCTD